MNRSHFQKSFAYFGLVIVTASFVLLGVWQWNRAQDSQRPIAVSSKIVSLTSLTQPRTSLPASAVLRRVRASGHYVGSLQAPHQIDGLGKESIWDVGMLQTDEGGVILVARGVWTDRVETPQSAKVEIVGKLMPHQSEDYVDSGDGVLRRIDSALVVGQVSADLYDGYLIAETEIIDGVASKRVHIEPPAPHNAVPGFYWQHLSYVIIWWFMAGVMLYLPFYQRRVTSKVEPTDAA
jgi:cytochrome oxidase assembly protein ShyY1